MWQLWVVLAVVGVLLLGLFAARLRRAGRTLDRLIDDLDDQAPSARTSPGKSPAPGPTRPPIRAAHGPRRSRGVG